MARQTGGMDAQTDGSGAFERSGLQQLFGDTPRVRILWALSRPGRQPLNASQIAETAGIDNSTFHRHKEALLETGLVTVADTPGGHDEYRLAEDTELVDGDERATALATLDQWTGAAIHDKDYSDAE